MSNRAKNPSIYRLEERERAATKEGKSLLGAPAKGGGVVPPPLGPSWPKFPSLVWPFESRFTKLNIKVF